MIQGAEMAKNEKDGKSTADSEVGGAGSGLVLALDSEEQPIFSFRYNKWKVLWRIGHLSFVFVIFYKIVFDWSLKKSTFMFIFSQLFGGMIFLLIVFSLYDVIFTHEIILYRRKIVKTWRVGIRQEVEFAYSKFGAMKTAFYSTKRFYHYWINNFFTPILGVFYDEALASNKDVCRINQLLSEISGRDISVFACSGNKSVSLNFFLKEGERNER